MSTTLDEVQSYITTAFAMAEAALPLAGLEDLEPVLQSIQLLEKLVVDAIEGKRPAVNAALAAEVVSADTAAEAAELAKFPNT